MILRAILLQMRSSTVEATELVAAVARDMPLAVAAIATHFWAESYTMTPSFTHVTIHG